MDGEVKLPETIWLIWNCIANRPLPAIDERGTPRIYCLSAEEAAACIASQSEHFAFHPGDLIPVEVRITPVTQNKEASE